MGRNGKDFLAGFVALGAFLFPHAFFGYRGPTSETRIVLTSIKDDHLRVLFGEIVRFIDTSKYPLRVEDGGPLIVNHRDIRKVVNGVMCPISYLRGMVSERPEGLAGHHASYTMCICDEASGIHDEVYVMQQGWAKRLLAFGNPNNCQNFFRKGIREGDLLAT